MNTVVSAAPLFCADEARDRAVRPLVTGALRHLMAGRQGIGLEAVILTGSLARGEGSVLLTADGMRLLGDIGFLVIVKPPFDFAAVRRLMVDLGRTATRELGADGRVASIEYTAAGISYLREAIRPSVFAADLVRHGRVLHGRPDILSEVRPFGADAIPADDAVRLIMNRMIESLTAGEMTGAFAREYHLVKTVLDLAGSALAFAGQYRSRYSERPAAFAALLSDVGDLRRTLPDPDGFVSALDRAVACKLAPTEERLAAIDLDDQRAAVNAWARALWLWEMRRLATAPEGTLDVLLQHWLAREPLAPRLRGWLKLWLHPLRQSGSVSALRTARLALRASPQALTYAAAVLAFWELTAPTGRPWQSRAAALLPLRRCAGASLDIEDVIGLWRWLIRNN